MPPAAARSVHPIDAFIRARQKTTGLRMNALASRRDLIRRATLDVTGLPPTPEEVAAFVEDRRPEAWDRVVDRLLASPRYGERWAQHWLDVVRYADTHGFEVNTERPHAWPYRDYVIRALNEDRPYDRFVREQLAGDVLNEDAATGFLVTAAVLLAGQIGADDASKRLARQDALSEIIANSSQTFLGLSIGCARCHNHKFEPISQRDYYAWQAFFAGVDYGDRVIRTPELDARRREGDALKARLTTIDESLLRLEPLARIDPAPLRPTNARTNREVFAPIEARYVRFTIHDANLHPSLGLIEPCIDELEIFGADEPGNNVALAAFGTKVTASGSRMSDAHRLDHVNDGRFGNSRSWMSDEAGRGWLLFELPRPTRIATLVWSRDREGQFNDRLATAYTIEAGLSLEQLKQIASVPPPRAAVHARRTIDRFAPVRTKRVRFTISNCTSLEPCLDELEVLSIGPDVRNVGLASAGAMATASGTLAGSELHQLEHINDGRYGNSRSWISESPGRGWVELKLAKPETIDRVVWSRDREEKFTDRLPTDYRIEVADESGGWQTVATQADRRPYIPNEKPASRPSLFGLSEMEVHEVVRLVDERKALEKKIAGLTAGQMVYGGTFGKPEVTRVLYRGDPEQPRESVQPAIPVQLGTLALASDAADPERRLALASWIASSANPLTARVMVNRIWQGHFGLGLVETQNDFGMNGSPPSHPELLDWLSGELVASGWSLKKLHRLILTSETYRQSSTQTRAARENDADDRLLSRFPSRRLEAETIRDSMLAVSGRLNLKVGGPGFDLFRARGGLNGFPPIEAFGEDGRRRMIYAHKIRMEREAVFGAFDCPDAGQSTGRRRQSTTPIQALNLFNSRFTLDESEAFAARVQRDSGDRASLSALIRRAYQLALCREPEAAEIRTAEPVVAEHGLATLCRVLYNSNEFVFLP